MEKQNSRIGANEMIIYEEPSPEGNIVTVITKEAATERQKQVAKLKGFEYNSNNEALDDFMTNNYAWEASEIKIIGDIMEQK